MTLVLCAACGDDSSRIEPGDDITGAWLGCANDACSENTLAGIQFEASGLVRVIRAVQTQPVRRCVEDEPLLEGSRWEWDGDRVRISGIAGVDDLLLELREGKLEVPQIGGELFFRSPALYPYDAEWMEPFSGDLNCE